MSANPSIAYPSYGASANILAHIVRIRCLSRFALSCTLLSLLATCAEPHAAGGRRPSVRSPPRGRRGTPELRSIYSYFGMTRLASLASRRWADCHIRQGSTRPAGVRMRCRPDPAPVSHAVGDLVRVMACPVSRENRGCRRLSAAGTARTRRRSSSRRGAEEVDRIQAAPAAAEQEWPQRATARRWVDTVPAPDSGKASDATVTEESRDTDAQSAPTMRRSRSRRCPPPSRK